MRNEPTTEIVEEITNQSTTNDIIVVLKMIVQYLESFTMDKMSRDVMSAAADRLESQAEENEINRHLIEMQSNVITELTARAESAERERDAAIDAIADIKENGFCGSCKGCNAPYVGQEKITFCYGWKWRGLQPQEGAKQNGRTNISTEKN